MVPSSEAVGSFDFGGDVAKGPLVFNPARRFGGESASDKIGERIGNWVCELGVNNPDILPNHAWRNRFKSVARRVGMDVGARISWGAGRPRETRPTAGAVRILATTAAS